jgi:hypothetical protein
VPTCPPGLTPPPLRRAQQTVVAKPTRQAVCRELRSLSAGFQASAAPRNAGIALAQTNSCRRMMAWLCATGSGVEVGVISVLKEKAKWERVERVQFRQG